MNDYKSKTVMYRGRAVQRGYPERVKAAQMRLTAVVAGGIYKRIRYGEELGYQSQWPSTCGDCGVIKGEFHLEDCDLERCPKCKEGQHLHCGNCEPADQDEAVEVLNHKHEIIQQVCSEIDRAVMMQQPPSADDLKRWFDTLNRL